MCWVKKVLFLPGGCEAKHTTNVLALHAGTVAASAAKLTHFSQAHLPDRNA